MAVSRVLSAAEYAIASLTRLSKTRWTLCKQSFLAPWGEVGLIMRMARVFGIVFWNGIWSPVIVWALRERIKELKETQKTTR